MADHGTVEYATAPGNDYPAHENTYARFIDFTLAGTLCVINIVFGLAIGGVTGRWFMSLICFIVAIVGVIPGLVSGSKMSSYVSFAICFLIFVYTTVSH